MHWQETGQGKLVVSCGASATAATVTLRFWLSVTKSLSGQSPELPLPLPVLVAAFSTSCLPGRRYAFWSTRPIVTGQGAPLRHWTQLGKH